MNNKMWEDYYADAREGAEDRRDPELVRLVDGPSVFAPMGEVTDLGRVGGRALREFLGSHLLDQSDDHRADWACLRLTTPIGDHHDILVVPRSHPDRDRFHLADIVLMYGYMFFLGTSEVICFEEAPMEAELLRRLADRFGLLGPPPRIHG